MKIRWKHHFQVVATYLPNKALEVEEKEELKSLLKWGKFSLYVIEDREIFTYLKNKKQLIFVQNFRFLNETSSWSRLE